jgi:hypothetical protein
VKAKGRFENIVVDVGASRAAVFVLLVGGCTRSGTVGVLEAATETTVGASDGDASGDPGLDLGDTGGVDLCVARGGMGGVGPCMHAAPAATFEPVVEWSWSGDGDATDVFVTPLVANLTDDDDNGIVDLCDKPDVVVVIAPPAGPNLAAETPPGRIAVLAGSGVTRTVLDPSVRPTYTPALGDIDADGAIEIVAVQPVVSPDVAPFPSRVIAMDASGEVEWVGEETFDAAWAGAVALADLDGDGDVEIVVADRVLDHTGRTLFVASEVGADGNQDVIPLPVDLDGDDDLEILWGRAAYHHDGARMFVAEAVRTGYPHVANLNADPAPEIIVTTTEGIAVLDNAGVVRFSAGRIPGIPDGAWRRPAAIHDFDGDGVPEVAMSAGDSFVVLTIDLAAGAVLEQWTASVADESGAAAGTAFDFLGDGTAEAMYADETHLYVFEDGAVVLEAARTSVTVHEYPVVADVDNDGSAEIVVVSNRGFSGDPGPAVRVFGEVGSRWVQARRIWNQHAYHVTNVLEDGTIPSPMPPSWLRLNTFRTNAQIEGGVVCEPEP